MISTKGNCCSTRCFDRQNCNPNTIEFCTSGSEPEMHTDLYTCRPRGPVIWGNVYDENKCPLEGCVVSLVSCEECCCPCSPCPPVICQTRSDMNGYYELELPCQFKGKYRIVVNCAINTERPGQRRQNCICYN